MYEWINYDDIECVCLLHVRIWYCWFWTTKQFRHTFELEMKKKTNNNDNIMYLYNVSWALRQQTADQNKNIKKNSEFASVRHKSRDAVIHIEQNSSGM